MWRILRNFCHDQRGATAVEYALICAFMFLAFAAILPLVAGEVSAMYNEIMAAMRTATS